MTPILKVISEYCIKYVDDDNYKSKAQKDKPLYAWQMWGILNSAIPLFTIPRDMQLYLVGTPEHPNITEPKFDSTIYTTQTELTDSTVIPLGEDFIGYELFCAQIRQVDDFGDVSYQPASNVTYNAETGELTIAATADAPVAAGTVYEMDFYTDGSFTNTLTNEQMMILGYCFQVIWQTNFNNNWLSNVPKIEDRSFTEQNRANKMNADTARNDSIRRQLAEQMRSYEQSLAFRKVFPLGGGWL